MEKASNEQAIPDPQPSILNFLYRSIFMSRTNISEAGMRIIRLLIGYPPHRMNDLILKTGVTRTAITEQINELIEAGFVEQTIERFQGRGRPRFLFSATPLALKQLFAGNQSTVVPAIWRAVRRYCNPDTVMKICHEVAQDIADQFNPLIAATDPKERLQHFHNLHRETGQLAQLTVHDKGLSFSKLSCPFISMYDESGTICMIDHLAMAKIVGTEIQRTSYRHHNDHCCVYTIFDDQHSLSEDLPQATLAD